MATTKTTKEDRKKASEKTSLFMNNEEYFSKQVGIDVFILDRFRLETRKDLHSSWLIVYDKYTDKVLLQPGTRKHLWFWNSDEALKYLREHYITPGSFKNFHLIEVLGEKLEVRYGSRNLVRVIDKKEYEEMVQKLNSLQKAVDGFVREKIEKAMEGDES